LIVPLTICTIRLNLSADRQERKGVFTGGIIFTGNPCLPTGRGSVGFPIAVAAYLLVRLEQKLEGLATSISELARVVERRN
jgi:hypothetical protein